MLAHAGVSAWEWHAHPDVWSMVVVLAGAYWLAVTRLGPSRAARGEPVVTARQVTFFGLGLLALWLHSDWPVHDIGEHYLFSVHMFQHIGLTLIAAPLFLMGLPGWLVRFLLGPRPVRAVFSRITRPLPAAVLFNTVIVFSHWPVVVNGSLEHHGVHFTVHFVLFTSALIMWFPVVNRLPELPTMTYPSRMLYVFLQSVVPTVPASFLTFGDGVLYRFYAHVPRPFSITAIDDQQVAGAMMKVYAGALLWGVIVSMFFRWYAREERDKVNDVLRWEDVDEELRRTEQVAPAEPRISP
ncbi:MAG TPA: cytochrome c oxidase assembly protein [Acidimicrobiales bacterium]|nr:cytochrome c oxidase assembly protein [Acidimicrobiales bacterium]